MVEETTECATFSFQLSLYGSRDLFRSFQTSQIVISTADSCIYMLPTTEQFRAGCIPVLYIPVLIPTSSLRIDSRVTTGKEVRFKTPVTIVCTIRVHHVIHTIQTFFGIGITLIHCSRFDDAIFGYIQELIVVT